MLRLCGLGVDDGRRRITERVLARVTNLVALGRFLGTDSSDACLRHQLRAMAIPHVFTCDGGLKKRRTNKKAPTSWSIGSNTTAVRHLLNPLDQFSPYAPGGSTAPACWHKYGNTRTQETSRIEQAIDWPFPFSSTNYNNWLNILQVLKSPEHRSILEANRWARIIPNMHSTLQNPISPSSALSIPS